MTAKKNDAAWKIGNGVPPEQRTIISVWCLQSEYNKSDCKHWSLKRPGSIVNFLTTAIIPLKTR